MAMLNNMYSSWLRRDTPQNKHQLKSLLYNLRGGGQAKRKSGPMARSRTLPNAQRDFINFIQNSNLPAHFVQLRGDGSCFYRGLQHFRPHGGASRWRFLITGRYGNDYAEEPDVVRGLRLANLHATVMTIEIENPNLEPFIFDVGPQNGDTVILINWTLGGIGMHFDALDPRGVTPEQLAQIVHDRFVHQPGRGPQRIGRPPGDGDVLDHELSRVNAAMDNIGAASNDVPEEEIASNYSSELDEAYDLSDNGSDAEWLIADPVPDLPFEEQFNNPHSCANPAKCPRTDTYHLCTLCEKARFGTPSLLIKHTKNCPGKSEPDQQEDNDAAFELDKKSKGKKKGRKKDPSNSKGGASRVQKYQPRKKVVSQNAVVCPDCLGSVSKAGLKTHKKAFHSMTPTQCVPVE